MPKLTDEDGIDGVLSRAMQRAMRDDAKCRQSIPTIKAAGVIQPPVRSARTIDEIFEATRAAVTLEPMTSIDWSPGQMCRRAS